MSTVANKSVKPAMNYAQQIKLLRKRGLVIEDEVAATELLSTFNYYRVSGYLHDFKIDSENYVDGLTLERIQNIIAFDKRLRNILMYAIETVEHTLKTKVAYHFAHAFDPLEYANPTSIVFKDCIKHNKFLAIFRKSLENNRDLPFVKHHNKHYDKKIPIWAAIEIFTMGMVYHFYSNLPTYHQKQIAKEFNIGAKHLRSWMEYVTYVRNLIAHHTRLYQFNLQKVPAKLNSDGRFEVTYRIFDILMVLKHLILDKNDWNYYVLRNIESLLEQYKEHVCMNDIGFPSDWYEQVKTI